MTVDVLQSITEQEIVDSLVDLSDCADLDRGYAAMRPRDRQRLLDWSKENIINDQGRPYDHAAYPHLGAPGGPMDAFDDHRVREITLNYATRLGKSFFGQCMMLYTQCVDPAPALVASESERSLKRVNKRTYQMIYANKRIRGKLRYWHERDHKQDFIEFKESPIFGGWARSAGTLADMNIKVAWANELDKEGWDQKSTSKEGAPTKLFSDRLKDYWSIRKILWESTPTIHGISRVESKMLQGNECRLEVPCPHCREYQELLFADCRVGELAALDAKRISIQFAEDGSAAYICRHCGERCEDFSRPWMIRRGVWAPKGMTVDSAKAIKTVERELRNDKRYEWTGWEGAGWVKGSPEKEHHLSSYGLSSLYALSLGWSDILSEFLSSQRRTELLRNFANQWLGLTWELAGTHQTWEELHKRIVVPIDPMIVPAEHVFLTCGIDKQQSHYVFVVDSWGPGRCSHTVDYGTCTTLNELTAEVLRRKYISEDGTQLRVARALIDRGFEPKKVDDFVVECKKKRIPVMPCRGSSQAMQSTYSVRTLGKDSSTPGLRYVLIDGTTTQDWLNVQLHMLEPGQPGSTSLFSASKAEHQDFLEQLLNEAAIEERDKRGKVKHVWVRLNEEVPNDYRDCKRYSAVAMALHTRGRIIRPKEAKKKKSTAKDQGDSPAQGTKLLERPSGWAHDWRNR